MDAPRGRALASTVAAASARETAVRLVRLGGARWAADVARARTTTKLLKDVPSSAARKRALALPFGPLDRAAVAPAVAGTAFRAGFLFAAADFIVSCATDAARAALATAGWAGVQPADAWAAADVARARAAAAARENPRRVVGAVVDRAAAAVRAAAAAAPALVFFAAVPALAPVAPIAAIAATVLGVDAASRAATAKWGAGVVEEAAARVRRHALRAAVCLSASAAAAGVAAALLPSTYAVTGAQLAADNAAYMLLVAPALAEQAEGGRVARSRALPLAAALAAAGAWGMDML